MFSLRLLALLFGLGALSAAGCAILSGYAACEEDVNCPSGQACAQGTCVAVGEGEGEGEGDPGEGEGEPGEGEGEGEGDPGEGEGEGEGEGDSDPCTTITLGATVNASSNGDLNVIDQNPNYVAAQCVRIVGSITIGGNVNNISGINKIVELTGDLTFANATAIDTADLTALNALITVNGSLRILNCDDANLTSVPFNNLATVTQDLEISGNENVNALGFGALSAVGGSVTFALNPNLCEAQDIDAFEADTGLTATSGTNKTDC